MGTPSREILRVAKDHTEIQVKLRSDLSADDLTLNILRKLGHEPVRPSFHFFERITPYSNGRSIDPNFLSLVRNFPARKIIVFFELYEDKHVFEFNSFSEFVDIYQECRLFSAYLTDADLNFIVCCTEEETLVVAGEAGDWLEEDPH